MESTHTAFPTSVATTCCNDQQQQQQQQQLRALGRALHFPLRWIGSAARPERVQD
jgi:hypothetical protein